MQEPQWRPWADQPLALRAHQPKAPGEPDAPLEAVRSGHVQQLEAHRPEPLPDRPALSAI